MATTKKDGVIVKKLEPFIGVARSAQLANVSRQTIRRWRREGRLKGYRQDGTQHLLIDTESLLRMLGVKFSKEE
jgi:predicted site-specific integrase-resolvase